MKGNTKKSRGILTLVLAFVMLISITVALGIYNNQSKADVAQQNALVEQVTDDIQEDSLDYVDEKKSLDVENESIEENLINPKEVRFMQSSIKNKTGEHTVLDNAEELKNGTLKPEDMPLIRLWKDEEGKIWTLDHRRLAAFRLAGLESVPFVWATEEEVANQMWKMTTTTDGKTIRLKIDKGKNMTVG